MCNRSYLGLALVKGVLFTKIKQFQKKHHTELLKKFFVHCPTLDFFFFFSPEKVANTFFFLPLLYLPSKTPGLSLSFLNVYEVSLYVLYTFLFLLTLLSDSASDVFQSYQDNQKEKKVSYLLIYAS